MSRKNDKYNTKDIKEMVEDKIEELHEHMHEQMEEMEAHMEAHMMEMHEKMMKEMHEKMQLMMKEMMGKMPSAGMHPPVVKPTKPGEFIEYQIKAGDTLFKLAEKFHTTVHAIKMANPVINPLNLQVGSTIKIPKN